MHSRQGDIADLNTENGVSNISKDFVSGIEYHVLVAPTAKEANLLELGDLLGQGREGSDLNFPVVGHFGRVSWEVVVGWMSRQVEASVNKGNWVRSLSPVWGSHEIRAGRTHQSSQVGHVTNYFTPEAEITVYLFCLFEHQLFCHCKAENHIELRLYREFCRRNNQVYGMTSKIHYFINLIMKTSS